MIKQNKSAAIEISAPHHNLTISKDTQKNIEEIERLSQSPQWKAYLERINNDAVFCEEEVKKMNSQSGKVSHKHRRGGLKNKN